LRKGAADARCDHPTHGLADQKFPNCTWISAGGDCDIAQEAPVLNETGDVFARSMFRRRRRVLLRRGREPSGGKAREEKRRRNLEFVNHNEALSRVV